MKVYGHRPQRTGVYLTADEVRVLTAAYEVARINGMATHITEADFGSAVGATLVARKDLEHEVRPTAGHSALHGPKRDQDDQAD